MNTQSIYNGLDYTTKEINRNFKIKVNGIVNGKKVNVLVGVSGLIKIVGDKYVDITFEMALKDDGFTGYEYVVFGEYPAGVIETITGQTGYYGEIYRFCYCAEQMALEKMPPAIPKGTTGGGTQ